MGPAVAVVALAATAVSTYQQHKAGRDASRAQQRAADEAQEQNKIGTAAESIRRQQQQRQSLREQRIRRARILQGAEGAGVAGGSGQAGSTSALGTLTGAQIGALGTQERGSQGIAASQGRQSGFQSQALSAQQSSNLWGGVGQLSGSIFQAAGGFPGLTEGINYRTSGTPQVVDLNE